MIKFKTNLIVLVAGFCLNVAFMSMPVKAGEMRFSSRGADDRTAEVLAAVKSGATLRFEMGEYHFRSPSKLEYSISNHDNPGAHRVFLPVTNVVDCHFNRDIITADIIGKVRSAGYEFHVWTVDNLSDTLAAFERGAQTVTTNCAMKLLDQYKSKGRKSAK